MVTYTATSVYIDGWKDSMIINLPLWMVVQVEKRDGVKRRMWEEVEREDGRVEKGGMQ